MRGIPLALGGSASLSVKREEGALCVERLAVFSPYIQPLLRRFVKKNCLPVNQDAFLVQLRVCFGRNANFGKPAIELKMAATLESCSFIFC